MRRVCSDILNFYDKIYLIFSNKMAVADQPHITYSKSLSPRFCLKT